MLAVIAIISSIAAQSQSVPKDSSFTSLAVQNAIGHYEKEFPQPIIVYTGPEYVEMVHDRDAFPFYKDPSYTNGSVIINNKPINNLWLKYECAGDLLILETDTNDLEIISRKVDGFSIFGEKFIRVTKNSTYGDFFSEGFYQVMYSSNNVAVFAKRKKLYNEYIEYPIVRRVFLVRDKFYIFRNDKMFLVKNRADIIKVFSDEKSTLRKYARSLSLDFKEHFDSALVTMVKKYEDLKEGL